MIFSSYVYELLDTVANRVIEINNDGTITDMRCTYQEFLDRKPGKK